MLGCHMGNDNMEKEILRIVQKSETGTWIEDVARELRINRATACKYITRLEALGKIRIEKKGQMKMIFPVIQ